MQDQYTTTFHNFKRMAKNNVLVHASKIYSESESVTTVLKVMANFIYYPSMSFRSRVHKDLNEGVLATESLEMFHVPWNHVAMEKQKPSKLGNYFLDMICKSTAAGLELQCLEIIGLRVKEIKGLLHFTNLLQKKRRACQLKTCWQKLKAKFWMLASVLARHSNMFKSRHSNMFKSRHMFRIKIKILNGKNLANQFLDKLLIMLLSSILQCTRAYFIGSTK